jgi:hypothetical protein
MTNNNEMTLTFWSADGEEISVEVSTHWAICPCCEGEGRVDNPAFSNGISGEEWANEWDEDEREAYMSGAYDVRCDECGGSGKVREPNLSSLTEEERKAYEEHLDAERYHALEREAEMRYGC